MKKIYVGNLDFGVTEDQLRSLFAAHGVVDKVTVVTDRDTGKPRGFGFVEMTNDAEAEKAMQALNGSDLSGRNLNVNEARPKAEGGGNRGGFRGDRPRGGSRRY
jgi:cold-inducible RNA-binding protein